MFNFECFQPCDTWNCFNSFALWISAIGMVTVSSISLWLSIKDKLVLVDGIFRLALIPSDLSNPHTLDRKVFCLSFVNMGRRKVKIDNFSLCSKVNIFKRNYTTLFPQLEPSLKMVNTQFPIRLDEMENSNIFFDLDFFKNLDNSVRTILFDSNYFLTWYKINTAYFLLDTSIGKQFKIKIHKEAKKRLWQQYKELKNKY